MNIEKNIPMPKPHVKYPFRRMEVGDSITVPNDQANSAQTSARVFGKRMQRKFTVRREGELTRIWRVS